MPIFAKKISLQVSSRMLGRLHDIAEQEELSLSEFTRWAIRDKLREFPSVPSGSSPPRHVRNPKL